jgi:hypothetical protein
VADPLPDLRKEGPIALRGQRVFDLPVTAGLNDDAEPLRPCQFLATRYRIAFTPKSGRERGRQFSTVHPEARISITVR